MDSKADAIIVRAAGGIVTRRSADRGFEVVLVHRPHREDWTFPKGKLDENETFEACALREVFEETGYHCSLGAFVGHTDYRDRKDRPKVVAYWMMEVLEGSFRPSEEVDELIWVTVDEACEILSYERDRELLVIISALMELGRLTD